MNIAHEIVLPVDIFIPVHWSQKREAILRGPGGRQAATVRRAVTYGRCLLGIPVSHAETLEYIPFDSPVPFCGVELSARFPLDFRDRDGAFLGRMDPKPLSVYPEYDCADQDGESIGAIRLGIRKSEVTSQRGNFQITFSSEKSKGLRPPHYVWECGSGASLKMDVRLLLGFVALGQMPDMGTAT